MAPGKVLAKRDYGKLVTDLRGIIEAARERAVREANREVVRMYWLLGERIKKAKLTKNAGYGDSIIAELSQDLGMDGTTLFRAVLFFEQYQKVDPWVKNLSWSHYRALLTLSDVKERNFYEVQAEKLGWKKRDLLRAIGGDVYHETERKNKGSASKPVRLKRPTEVTYVYKALVERVIDGDTLLLRIDLGFEVQKVQRLRLESIDTPPLKTAKGRAAFEFVRDALAGVAFVMVKTHKVDVHGRYVGDVFYSRRETVKAKVFAKGRHLNQELLTRGLAKPL